MGSPVLLGITVLAFLYCSFSTASSSSPPTTPLHNTSDTDLQALLCLKQHLSGTTGDMASWRSDSAQYCSWPGVTCDKRHTSRVFSLALDSDNLHGQIPPCIGNLTFLRSIHLPNNKLDGQIPPELGRLRRLTYLNLSYNGLTSAIPDSLSSCSRLQIIDLSNNFLEGDIPSSLEGCSALQEMYLFNNKLSGVIPDTLGTLSNLSVLYLAQNNLTGGIPSSLGSNSFLSALILTNNTLTGGIPPVLANCPSLQWLDLTNNQLSGEIPSALFNSSSIVVLALGVNNFVGSIPQLAHISSPLETLILSQNNLSGSIPSSLGNFSSLSLVLLSQNNFQGSIPSSLSKIPNLEQLDLSYNNLSGTVPASLYKITALTYLNIAMNDLWGEIPYDIGHTLPNLQTLNLQGNIFKGQIPVSLANATNIQVLRLRDNLFHGIVPSFGNLPNLTELNIGMNQLEAGDWTFLSTLTNCSQLVQLCLDSNILKGTLPNSIGDLPRSLQVLLLTANQISGTIPQEIEHLKNLTLLYMEQNLLEGSIPDSVGNLQNLFVLSLSRNKLSGQVPLSIGNLSQLSELNLQENNFSGSIPRVLGYCKNLESLNLSYNSFSGSIPKELFTLFSLSEGLDLSHNKLSGEIPLDIGDLINLDLLNISNNQLSGVIPPSLGNCLHLVSLHLEDNLLQGTIPESFIKLRGVSEMDLSRNNLSGQIPVFFESLTSMKLLNLSFNNLEGPVPTSGIFQNTGEVFLQGNKLLCANIPLLQLPRCSSSTGTSKTRRALVILKIVGFSTLPLFLLSCLAVILLKKRKKAKQASHPSRKELKKFSYADLVKATNGFSLTNLLGSGKSGSVYKGRFEFEEHTVAVKVFKLDQLGTQKSFLTECETLRNTRHRNLVRVITACSTFDALGQEFKALILEYMPNGSLESWLYPKPNMYGLKIPLSLGSRITIAMDIASALDYLHNHCMPPVVHCDLKPSNVLLDDEIGARLADFGLAKFLHNFNHSCHHSSTSLLGPRGSIGYIAPEYGFGNKLSTEGDVYSYGIIILEMLTGKRPTDEMFTNGLNLHKFVEQAFPQKIREVLDPCIILSSDGDDVNNNLDHANNATAGVEGCILHLAKLGLSCSMEAPNDRPTTQDIYADVIKIKEAFAAIYMIE